MEDQPRTYRHRKTYLDPYALRHAPSQCALRHAPSQHLSRQLSRFQLLADSNRNAAYPQQFVGLGGLFVRCLSSVLMASAYHYSSCGKWATYRLLITDVWISKIADAYETADVSKRQRDRRRRQWDRRHSGKGRFPMSISTRLALHLLR